MAYKIQVSAMLSNLEDMNKVLKFNSSFPGTDPAPQIVEIENIGDTQTLTDDINGKIFDTFRDLYNYTFSYITPGDKAFGYFHDRFPDTEFDFSWASQQDMENADLNTVPIFLKARLKAGELTQDEAKGAKDPKANKYDVALPSVTYDKFDDTFRGIIYAPLFIDSGTPTYITFDTENGFIYSPVVMFYMYNENDTPPLDRTVEPPTPVVPLEFEILEGQPQLSLDEINTYFANLADSINNKLGRDDPVNVTAGGQEILAQGSGVVIGDNISELTGNFGINYQPVINLEEGVEDSDAITVGQAKEILGVV